VVNFKPRKLENWNWSVYGNGRYAKCSGINEKEK
jgi:hypothetical protein